MALEYVFKSSFQARKHMHEGAGCGEPVLMMLEDKTSMNCIAGRIFRLSNINVNSKTALCINIGQCCSVLEVVIMGTSNHTIINWHSVNARTPQELEIDIINDCFLLRSLISPTREMH